MRWADAAKAIVSGCCVYYAMAACSAGGGAGEPGAVGPDGQPAPGASGAAPNAGPVKEALAQTSGTRIKAKRIVSADGATQFRGWYDAELGKECGFNKMCGTNEYRCLAIRSAFPTGYYGDSACTKPVYSLSTESGSIVALADAANACTTLRLVGQQATTTYVKGAQCTAVAYPTPVFMLEGEANASSFVLATERTDP
jgi:hypothetical protein